MRSKYMRHASPHLFIHTFYPCNFHSFSNPFHTIYSLYSPLPFLYMYQFLYKKITVSFSNQCRASYNKSFASFLSTGRFENDRVSLSLKILFVNINLI